MLDAVEGTRPSSRENGLKRDLKREPYQKALVEYFYLSSHPRVRDLNLQISVSVASFLDFCVCHCLVCACMLYYSNMVR